MTADGGGTETVAIASGQVTVCWRRSTRARRISMRIDARSGHVVLTLPPRGRREDALALLRSHSSWVAANLARVPQAPRWRDGGHILLDGRPHAIRHCPQARRGVWIESDVVHVSGEAEFLVRRLTTFLREQARTRLGACLETLAREAGLRPARLTIRDTRSRWGSCTADGAIMLCWRLVMAPREVQHYVIAHELAHLRHMNHGPDFWMLVDRLTPHRRHAETWLRREGAVLLRDMQE
ncbi:M48 family metallopeptidase [Novacetimonas pomaceti]|uniref:Zinc metallopeptidase n=1 Tax=Novacetimonas pomaceti TaxID=2021998 RepID=A0ABX5NYY0_9PROT|nr:SprT family zinc-dependent metalloprotease [Novacetimonas pomaceti]PYD46687.1 zinc metallopeptidase [Novacetimonas pomaceti]